MNLQNNKAYREDLENLYQDLLELMDAFEEVREDMADALQENASDKPGNDLAIVDEAFQKLDEAAELLERFESSD